MKTNDKSAKHFWVTSTGKARGGWIVASVLMDETAGPHYQTGIATKAEANRIADNLNQELLIEQLKRRVKS